MGRTVHHLHPFYSLPGTLGPLQLRALPRTSFISTNIDKMHLMHLLFTYITCLNYSIHPKLPKSNKCCQHDTVRFMPLLYDRLAFRTTTPRSRSHAHSCNPLSSFVPPVRLEVCPLRKFNNFLRVSAVREGPEAVEFDVAQKELFHASASLRWARDEMRAVETCGICCGAVGV
ncbi:hypothetical protein Tcan_00147 [Toxocara canis]|uniref:Uncharacterized protein n=1 Tax=Toxocara canis TaxID=6265 RepID=A0A0B2VBT3_TOXCA|nr:hypothetical protein Tcan_00147 [Toxocara canis]